MTKHVLDRLPLWVEEDLPDREATEIRAHLEGCDACRAFAEALRSSQAWMKAAADAPFDDADFADLRRKVMLRLPADPKPSRGLPFRPLLLTAAAGLLAALAMPLARRHHPARPTVTASPASPPPPPNAFAAATLPSPPSSVPHQARLRLRPRPEASSAGPSRIELQTDNPHVRIIWLAQARPEPAPFDPHSQEMP